MRGTVLAALILLCGASPAPAQEAPRPREPGDSAVVALPPIDVSVTRGLRPADRSPVALSVLDLLGTLRDRPAIGLEEALLTVPGVLVANRYNFALGSRVSIRGHGARSAFGVRGVKIVLDGVPLTLPDGQAALNNLDLASAGRVEVIRGPASSLYGNAAGGVIAIESAPPASRGWSAHGRALVGTLSTDRWTNLRKVEAGGSGVVGGAGYAVDVTRLEVEGFREHSRAESLLANLRARVPLDDGSYLSFVVNATHAPVAQNPGALPLDSARQRPEMAWPGNVRTGSGEAADQLQAGASYVRRVGDGRVEVSLYGLGRGLENALPFGHIELGRGAGGMRASLGVPHDLAGRRLFWTMGVDVDAQRDHRIEHDNDGGRPGAERLRDQLDAVTSVGPFVQGQLRLGPRVEVMAGARYDRVALSTDDRLLADGDDSGSRTLAAFSPTAGAVVSVRPGLSLYGNVATSFQTPTTTELINAPPPPGEPCCPGGFNAGLRPQRTLGLELGLRGRLASVELDLAAFHARVTDELVPFQVEDAPDREFFRNVGRSRHRGVEVGLAWTPSPRLRASAAYTFSDLVLVDDGADTRHEGNRLPGVPRHRLAARAELVAPAGLRLQADLLHRSEMFADDANTARSPASTVVDLRVGSAREGRVSPFLGVQNLFDTRYNASVVVNAFGDRYYEPAPGRSLYLGVRVRAGVSSENITR